MRCEAENAWIINTIVKLEDWKLYTPTLKGLTRKY
jgi:hypothetical protein